MNFYNGGSHGEQYGDKEFIDEQIEQLPYELMSDVKDKYSEIYELLLREDKDNARYRVNTWLRKVVKKHKPVDSKHVWF